jgi:hypothetical protein
VTSDIFHEEVYYNEEAVFPLHYFTLKIVQTKRLREHSA